MQISISEFYNLPCFDLTYSTNAKIEHYVSLMQQCILYWQHNMQYSNKLEFVNAVKNYYSPSSYLSLTSKLS